VILLFLDSRVREKGYVSDIRFFEDELRGVLTKIGVNEDVPVILVGDTVRRSEN
jgi:hypothetical protein